MSSTEDVYFVIHNVDGDTYVSQETREEVLERFEEYPDLVVLDEISYEDTNYWGGKYLIVKGKIVTPQPKQVVTKYELE